MIAIAGPWRHCQARFGFWPVVRGTGSLKAAGGALAALLMATTPALAGPDGVDTGAAAAADRGYRDGKANNWGSEASRGGDSEQSRQAYRTGRFGGFHERSQKEQKEKDTICPHCAFGADRADSDDDDIGNTGGFNGSNSNFN